MEAVIISGMRKGEFITLDNDNLNLQWTPEADAVLEGLVSDAKRMAANAHAAAVEADALLDDLRQARSQVK